MNPKGYDYLAFRRGIAARDGTGCWVKRLLVARRASVIERWREGSYGDVDRLAGWIPGNLFDCDGQLDGHHAGLSKSWIKDEFRRTEFPLIIPAREPLPSFRDLHAVGVGVFPRVHRWESLADMLNDPRNGILVCRRHHDLLENARIVIARADLPESVEEFAAELGERAVARLERDFGMDRES